MRWAAKAQQDKLEWSILDVEQEEWERRLADLGVAAAANGYPVYPAAPSAQSAAPRVPRNGRRILAAVVLLVVLGGLAGYGMWRRAEEGIVRIKGDVANAVKVENLQESSQGPAQRESVQAVEFLGSAAQATVLVTRTLATGGLSVQPELRFYMQTPKGWERSEPVAGFWGPTETLSTAHLHFVFRRRDKSVVEEVAPDAEALYAALRRATGLALTGAGHDLTSSGLLTIEIIPNFASSYPQLSDGRIRLTSPSLYRVAVHEREELLGQLLRRALCEQLMDSAVQTTAVKAQWLPMVAAFRTWLVFSAAMPLAPDDEAAALRRGGLRLPRSAWRLVDLQEDRLRYDPQIRSMRVFTLISDSDQQEQRKAAAEQLIDYIAGKYGLDVLPGLLEGFVQYENWEELAPAVLGVSAAELEKGWHGAMREGAPLHTFR